MQRANEPWLNLPNTPSLPGKPAGKTVDVNGAKLWYAEFGNVQSKEVPLILLHGGFGNSDYYGTMDAQKLTFELYASDITGLLKNLGISKAAFPQCWVPKQHHLWIERSSTVHTPT
ncbi:hypothetical protein BY996DRAFT_6444893, partial [Phakopsora pachyrhizi]